MKKLKKNLLLLFLTACAGWPACTAAQQDSAMARLKSYFSRIAAYHSQYAQEKVYLHLDNNGYFPGETLWFKAYVVGASTLLPTDLSRVLYVELLTPEGQVMQRRRYPILNGRTWGEFHLDDIIHSGYYEVRAYTRAMLNWDPHCAYSRVIPIYDTPRDSLHYGRLTLYEPTDPADRAFPRPAAAPQADSSTQRAKDMRLTFYPESGSIVQGIPCRVAYRLTDKKGLPMQAQCTLQRTDGTLLGQSQPLHEGMGLLSLPADWQGGQLSVTSPDGHTARFTLPQPLAQGCALQADSHGDSLVLTLQASPGITPQPLGISITCRGAACWFDTISLRSGQPVQRTVPRHSLHDGIHQVTLFTPQGRILAERMVWTKPRRQPMQFTVAQNQAAYEPFSPVALDFTLTEADGTPRQGEFSLAVHDADSELAADGTDICTDLLLSSDLRGYIHRPEYYFEADDEEHARALDLLLMVQGWRRYRWEEMAGTEPFRLRHPAEEGLLVDGKVVDNSSKHRGKAGMDVNLMLQLGQKFSSGSTRSDSAGHFALMVPDFYGEGTAYFTTTVADKRKSCNVALNRGFSPAPLAYEPLMLASLMPETREEVAAAARREEPRLFQWTDTLPRIVHLPEVGVKEKNWFPKYGSRFTWMGGEDEGKRHATLYYNVESEMEQMLDGGDREPSLWDWLASVNPHLVIDYPAVTAYPPLDSRTNRPFSYSSPGGDLNEGAPTNPILTDTRRHVVTATLNNPILTYKGRPVIIKIDNDRPVGDIDYLMGDVRSLVICEDAAVIRQFDANFVDGGPRQPVLFLLYSHLNNTSTKYRKGQRVTRLQGFSKYEEFFSPDYRRSETPSPKDTRRTLYWAPNVTTDPQGKAHVIFFSNCRPSQRLHINAQGISATGQLFSHQ